MKYLTIYPFVAVHSSDDKVIFYNTINFISFIEEKSPEIDKVLTECYNSSSVVEIDNAIYSDSRFRKFVTKIERHCMGFIENKDVFIKRPFSPPLYSFLNLTFTNYFVLKQKSLFENIREVSIYLTNNSSTLYKNTFTQKLAAKQFLYQISHEKENQFFLNINSLREFLISIPKTAIINLLGGNILEYEWLLELKQLLSPFSIVRYHIHYLDIAQSRKDLIAIFGKSSIRFLVDFPVKKSDFELFINKSGKLNYSILFVIESTYQFNKASKYIHEYLLKKYSFRTFYNGSNWKFFEENVLFQKKNVLKTKQSIDELLVKNISNFSGYGKLIVDCDGKIFTSVNTQSVSHIDKFAEERDSLLYHLLTNQESDWLIRKNFLNPCSHCLYVPFCTPFSDFERVFGKPNLCKD